MRIKKIHILALVSFIIIGCNSNMSKEDIREMFTPGSSYMSTYYDDVFLANLDIPKDKLFELNKDYYAKILQIVKKRFPQPQTEDSIQWKKDFSSYWFTKEPLDEEFFRKRINLNNIEKFKEIGVDIPSQILRNYSLAGLYFDSPIIFTGSVIDSTLSVKNEIKDFNGIKKEISSYSSNYKIKINNVIRGNEILNKFPNEIVLYNNNNSGYTYSLDEELYRYNKTVELEKKHYINDYTRMNIGETVLILLNDDFRIVMMEEFLSGFHNLRYNRILYSGTITDYTDSLSVEQVVEYFKILEEINDTPNFFNRSYK